MGKLEYVEFGPGYRVGSDGSVWSARPKNGVGGPVAWRPLRQKVTRRGYHEVSVLWGGRRKHVRVSRLVASAFIPNPDGKPEVNHRSGNKSDNSLCNLEWATRSENELHAYRTGIKLGSRGERAYRHKLTTAQVMDIYRRIRSGERVSDLARAYGVHQATISDIKLGRSWGHLLTKGGVS